MYLLLILFLFYTPIDKACLKRTILKEDFGLFEGIEEWNDTRDILSEVNLRNRLQKDGLRYKMTKTDEELMKDGWVALTPVFNLGPFQLYPPCAISEDERGGWNATSNNKKRRLEKIKAKKKVKEIKKLFAPLQNKWLYKYGYAKFVGDWFYADQLSSDNEDSGGGFNMKKGGYYPDGTYKIPD